MRWISRRETVRSTSSVLLKSACSGLCLRSCTSLLPSFVKSGTAAARERKLKTVRPNTLAFHPLLIFDLRSPLCPQLPALSRLLPFSPQVRARPRPPTSSLGQQLEVESRSSEEVHHSAMEDFCWAGSDGGCAFVRSLPSSPNPFSPPLV